MALLLQVAVIVAIQLLCVIKLWSRRVPILFRAVDLVELFLGVIHRPGMCEQISWQTSGATLRMAIH